MDATPTRALLPRITGVLGLLGATILGGSMLLAALPYRGRIGEPYSMLNHFVSELGDVGVTPGAATFNGGLIVGGAVLALFMAGLSTLDRHPLLTAAAVVGVAAATFAVGVGFVPMNHLVPHLLVAGVFFLGGLTTVALFTLYQWRVRWLPRSLLWAGLPALVSFIVLVVIVPATMHGIDLHDLPLDERRPAVWAPPIVEWIVVISTLAWVAIVGAYLAWAGPRRVQED